MHKKGENPSDSKKYRYFLKLWETNTTLRQLTMLMENTEDQLKRLQLAETKDTIA